MPDINTTVAAIVDAPTWNQRVALIRRIPEDYGIASHRDVYKTLAKQLYVPQLTADFAYVFPRPEYDLPPVTAGYRAAHELTDGFARVDAATLAAAVMRDPRTTIVWRLIVGYTWSEFAAATKIVAAELELKPVSEGRVKALERGEGRPPKQAEATLIAEVTTRAVAGMLWPEPEDGQRSKQERPDLADGWNTIQYFASSGVPLEVFLHQRNYGGAFRQLLDATGRLRGDVLEQELEEELQGRRIPYVRTGAHYQGDIRNRFNLTIQPAPDFVFFDSSDTVRGILEAKLTNDGGTARDKAARFAALRRESQRLGGIPVLALVDGLGWTRVPDALGPVVRDCDGRVYTRATLIEMFDVDPFPQLAGLAL